MTDGLTWALFGAMTVAVVLWVLAHQGDRVTFDGLVLVLVLAGLVVLVVRYWLWRPKRAEVVQPVSKPVVKPVGSGFGERPQPAQPAATVNDYRRQPVSTSSTYAQPVAVADPQPAATRPQPAATRSQPAAQPAIDSVFGSLSSVGFGSWPTSLDEAVSAGGGQAGYPVPTWDAVLDVVDAPTAEDDKVVGALLARVPPRLVDYYLIKEVIEGTRSQNEAIRELWGSKDGRTYSWLVRVRDFFSFHPEGGRANIIAWELEQSGDDVVDVAERLGVSVEEVERVFNAD